MRQLIRGARTTPASPTGWGSFEPATTFDTRIGLGVDATGYTTLTKDASARYVYVKNGGSDANSGLTDALAKATINAGFGALRDGSADWLLIDKNSSFAEGIGTIITKRDGLNAAYPTVVTTYDATDPTNVAKFRLGTFTFGTAPTGPIFDNGYTSGRQMRFVYFENGRCAKPIATPSTPASDYVATIFGGPDGLDRLWMFYNWCWTGSTCSIQGDYTAEYVASSNCSGNTTSGSASITGVSLLGIDTPLAGDHINGKGPLTGIPEDSVVVSWTPGTSTLVINQPCTASKSGAVMNFNCPKWLASSFIFRRCVFAKNTTASGHAQGLYLGKTDFITVEDCIGYHNGYAGNRNSLPNLTMSANATATNTGVTITLGGNSSGTIVADTTNGSAVLLNVTLSANAYLDDSAATPSSTLSGTGIPGATTLPDWNKGYQADIYNHNFYFATSTHNTIFRRNVAGHGSSHGLQARGGGQVSDNIFGSNALNLQFGGGDDYNAARPYGVPLTGGHNIVVGTAYINPGLNRGTGISFTNVEAAGSQTKNIITKYQAPAVPYNVQPLIVATDFDQPSTVKMSSSIVHDWPGEVTFAAYRVDPAHNSFPAQATGALTNNDVDADLTSWNGFSASSGNTTGTTYPDPERTVATYATANGYADETALWEYMILHPEVNWALSMQAYFQAGFGH